MRSAQSTSYRYIRARSLFIPVTYYSEHVIPYPYDIINDQPQESFPIGIWLLQIKCVGADVETNIIRNKFCANTKHTHVQYTHTQCDCVKCWIEDDIPYYKNLDLWIQFNKSIDERSRNRNCINKYFRGVVLQANTVSSFGNWYERKKYRIEIVRCVRTHGQVSVYAILGLR